MESIQKTLIEKGTPISSQEALSGVIPINWSKDVLDGKCKDKTIIKSKESVESLQLKKEIQSNLSQSLVDSGSFDSDTIAKIMKAFDKASAGCVFKRNE